MIAMLDSSGRACRALIFVQHRAGDRAGLRSRQAGLGAGSAADDHAKHKEHQRDNPQQQTLQVDDAHAAR